MKFKLFIDTSLSYWHMSEKMRIAPPAAVGGKKKKTFFFFPHTGRTRKFSAVL